MFDVIGKRRWFFLFSGLLTIPGLIFILLTPITGGSVGLQFSIDYTGGTDWEIHFKDPTVTSGPDQGRLRQPGDQRFRGPGHERRVLRDPDEDGRPRHAAAQRGALGRAVGGGNGRPERIAGAERVVELEPKPEPGPVGQPLAPGRGRGGERSAIAVALAGRRRRSAAEDRQVR